jgi:hypothetical protein
LSCILCAKELREFFFTIRELTVEAPIALTGYFFEDLISSAIRTALGNILLFSTSGAASAA